MASAVRVGAAAEAAGVGVQTLHYYEREGLIEPPDRSAAGYREYDAGTVERVRAIKRAQGLGFTLREIRALIGVARDRGTIEEVRTVARGRLAEIDARMEELQRARDALTAVIAQCECDGDVDACDVVDGLSASKDEGRMSNDEGGCR
jgi:MerR family copper efflux transcriptional regulator